ncbi:MAG TPA: hypothetical protein VHM19_10925, partial [Polyangiales bacterium]|nr:hypothetical protein [Polyangiales bacterium]
MLAFAAACSASVDVLEGPGKPGKTPDGVDGGSPTQGCSFCGALELCAIDRCIDSSGTTVLAAGLRHTCQITDGELWCWGENTSGQLGLGNTSSHATPTRVGDANDWLDVAGGQHHTCGLRAPGQLWCWGENNVGQLGLGDTAPHFEPTRVGVIEDFSDVSCGGDNCCALRSGHTLYCWGDNLEGSPGQNDTPGALDVLTPSRVAGSLAIQRFSVGGAHSCAIRDDGALYCWGRNNDGELGLGSADPQRREPTRVGMDTDWRSIAAGQHHTCGVRGRGELYCWGRNDF